jgi:hypothetical protein
MLPPNLVGIANREVAGFAAREFTKSLIVEDLDRLHAVHALLCRVALTAQVVRLGFADLSDHMLIRDTRTLGPIAVHTCGGKVPAVIAAAMMARDNVIDFKLYVRGLCSAVSACVFVAAQDLIPNTSRHAHYFAARLMSVRTAASVTP